MIFYPLSFSIHPPTFPVGSRYDGKCISPHSNVFCYFLEIFDYIDARFSLFFHKVTFDSFSSSAPSTKLPRLHGREAGGFHGVRLQPPSSMTPDPRWHSGKPH